MTRSAVSQQLSILERDCGVVLFNRTRRGTQLTTTGRWLAARAHEIIDAIESIETDLAAATTSLAGEVRVGAFGSAGTSIIPIAFRALRREHPQISLSFIELESKDGLRAASTKQVDIALVHDLAESETAKQYLDFVPLCADTLALVVSSSHRLADKRNVRISELRQERWVINTTAASFHGFVTDVCRQEGFSPRIQATTKNQSVSIELARYTDMVTVLPKLALPSKEASEGISVVAILPKLRRIILAALLRGTSRRPVIAAVLNALAAAAGEVSDRIE